MADLEAAAKAVDEIQNSVSPNAAKQLDRIKEKIRLIPDSFPERLEKIDQLLKVVPADLNEQLTRLNLGLGDLRDKTMKNLKLVYVASLTLFQAAY